MSASGVSLSAAKTCSSTIGPAGLDSTPPNVWSLAAFRWKTTVVGSGRVDRGDLVGRADGQRRTAAAGLPTVAVAAAAGGQGQGGHGHAGGRGQHAPTAARKGTHALPRSQEAARRRRVAHAARP